MVVISIYDGSFCDSITVMLSTGMRAHALSPQHAASSGCGWRNGLQYEG